MFKEIFHKERRHGHVRVKVRDCPDLADGEYWIPKKTLQAIIEAENLKIDEGGVFYQKIEITPL